MTGHFFLCAAQLLFIARNLERVGDHAECGQWVAAPHPLAHRGVAASDDQEVAARLIQEADLIALPVVDSEDRLVGIITVDDAMEIIEAEDTEDISRAAGGVEPLDRPYMAASVLHLARKRAVWLLVLIIAAALTVSRRGTRSAFPTSDELQRILAS
jgi:Mg/Co/Ni transporter MgtE